MNDSMATIRDLSPPPVSPTGSAWCCPASPWRSGCRPGLDPVDVAVQRAVGAELRLLHRVDAGARFGRRRDAQRHRRQPDDGRHGDRWSATPIGILAGIYLAEYGASSDLPRLRASSSTSCCRRRRSCIGLFVYAVAVATVGAFLRLGGSIALVADRGAGGRAHDGEHAGSGARQPARGRLRARRAALEGQPGAPCAPSRAAS